MVDDLFPADPNAPGDPAGDPQPSGDAQPAAPTALTADAIGAAVSAALAPIASRLEALESRGAPQAPVQPPAAPAAPADPNAAFNEMYANPAAYVEQRAGAVVERQLNDFATKLTPFFGTVADQLAARGIDAARDQFDGAIGAGAYDKLVRDDLATALAQLPPAQRADANYVRALAAGVLGGKMLSAEGQKEVRDIMAAARQRPAAPVVVTGNRTPPPPDRLSEDERAQIDRVRRSGIPVDEKSFLEGRNRPRTEEAWGATWMNPPLPTRRPNGAAK